ncbi:MAG: PIN domain-containing protein [Bacteroidota bacterium]
MSRRVYIDTNIMLDLLGEREPFYLPAARLFSLADQQKLILVCSPLSFATVSYFLTKFENPAIAKDKLRRFKIIITVCRIDEAIVDKSLNSDFTDFEDALHYFTAVDSKCEVIITRNAKDFKNSALPVMSAEEFLESLE